jgi:hypothetical protein
MALPFSIDLSGVGSAVQGVGKGITDFVAAIQGKLTPEQQIDLTKFQATTQAALDAAQAAVDEKEAQSSSFFVAGWRPFIGWICGSAIAYNFLLIPFGNLILSIVKKLWAPQLDFSMPTIDMGALWTLVTAMLGLGTMRTVEKLGNAAGNH